MSKIFTSDKPTVDEILRLKKPNRVFTSILLDPNLFQAVTEKQKEVTKLQRLAERGRSLSDKSPAAAEEELEALEAQAEEASVVFVFQDIGRKRYDEMVSGCAPTDAQKQQWREEANEGRLAYNPDLFIPLLVSACSITLTDEEEVEWRNQGGSGTLSPEISHSQAEKIYEEWGEGDIEAMFFGAVRACKERTSIPLSKRGIAPTVDSNLNSTTALNGESPIASS